MCVLASDMLPIASDLPLVASDMLPVASHLPPVASDMLPVASHLALATGPCKRHATGVGPSP